jgi:IS30 family transposase
MHFFKRAKKRAKMPPKKQLKIGVKNRSRTAKNTVNQGSWEQRCKIPGRRKSRKLPTKAGL